MDDTKAGDAGNDADAHDPNWRQVASVRALIRLANEWAGHVVNLHADGAPPREIERARAVARIIKVAWLAFVEADDIGLGTQGKAASEYLERAAGEHLQRKGNFMLDVSRFADDGRDWEEVVRDFWPRKGGRGRQEHVAIELNTIEMHIEKCRPGAIAETLALSASSPFFGPLADLLDEHGVRLRPGDQARAVAAMGPAVARAIDEADPARPRERARAVLRNALRALGEEFGVADAKRWLQAVNDYERSSPF